MNKEEFIRNLNELNISYTDNELTLLDKYYHYLIEYNENVNLTGITEEKDVYLKHFYDSLTIFKYLDLTKYNTLIDIGSGAGFPGVVLKIFFPNLKITLLDSNGKKTTFLTKLIEHLGLKDITVINDRAEEYALKHLNEFDLCTSRAVAFIDIILSLSIPFVKKDGFIILMKGNIDSEKPILEKHKDELNIKDFTINNFNLYNNDLERNILIISKKSDTDKVLSYSNIVKRNKSWNRN